MNGSPPQAGAAAKGPIVQGRAVQLGPDNGVTYAGVPRGRGTFVTAGPKNPGVERACVQTLPGAHRAPQGGVGVRLQDSWGGGWWDSHEQPFPGQRGCSQAPSIPGLPWEP